MSENKTKQTRASVTTFIDSIEDEVKRRDSKVLVKLMKEATGKPARLWGPSIIGFGKYHYKYESGREGDFLMVGFSPRKQNIAVYIMTGFSKYQGYLTKLGKQKTGKSCLYIKRLSDVDMDVLRALVADSVTEMQARYECE